MKLYSKKWNTKFINVIKDSAHKVYRMLIEQYGTGYVLSGMRYFFQDSSRVFAV